MSESIKTQQLLPADTEKTAIQKAHQFIEDADAYEFGVQKQDLAGRSQILFDRNGFNLELIVDDDSSVYTQGTLVTLHVQVGRLEDTVDFDAATNLRKVIETTKDIHSLFDTMSPPVYGVETGQGLQAPVPDEELPPFDRPFITWFDVYPPEEAETIGRETLLSVPAEHVEELEDGSVLVVSKHPASGESLDAVADHVGKPTWRDVQGPVR